MALKIRFTVTSDDRDGALSLVLLGLSFAISQFIDHQRSGVVYNFGCVRLSVCLSDDNFRKP